MARQTSKILFFLFISVSVFLFILSREHLQQSISWKAVSKNLRSREKGSLFDNYAVPQQEKGNWTPPSVVFSTSHKAKFANTTQRSSETKLKNDLITTSPQAETPIPVIFHKSFNKLPQWDFEDVYNEDAPPRLTNCAPSLRNSKDEAFHKDFLPNIRLFLYKDNIDMREWNRLSHFNSPFGFMELKYDDVMASVKLIPKPKEPLLPPKPTGNGCVHCAVVGTAGILNGSKLGAEIDAHDYVFRMNGAIIEGFEEDIGNRTSVYVHTAHSITASPFFFQKYGYTSVPHDEGIKYVLIPEGMRDFQWLEGLLKGERISAGKYANKEPRTYYSGQYNESRFYVLHQDFLRYVRNRFLRSSNLNTTYWPIVRPTNGAFTLFLALHTCDIVSAYGFITEDYNKYSNYYFQKHIKSDLIFYINHDYILEKDLWKSLHDRKIIHLYQRTGPQEETEKLKESWYST